MAKDEAKWAYWTKQSRTRKLADLHAARTARAKNLSPLQVVSGTVRVVLGLLFGLAIAGLAAIAVVSYDPDDNHFATAVNLVADGSPRSSALIAD